MQFSVDEKELGDFLAKELVGIHEITEMVREHPRYRGGTKQRANVLTQTAGFPPPIPTTLARGRLWYRSQVQKFLDEFHPPMEETNIG